MQVQHLLARPLLALTLALSLATGGCHAVAHDPHPADSIHVLLRAQQSAWNRGDIESFMAAGYWNSPELTFLSGGSWTQGYEPVLERYRERYLTGDGQMGNLSFSRVEVVTLSRGLGLARGAWHLTFIEAEPVSGLFTLILRQFPEGWRIVHDHTSLDS